MRTHAIITIVSLVVASCSRPDPRSPAAPNSARRAFGDTIATMLVDTMLFELRGHLFVKIPNPNRDDESPLADREVAHPSQPGPHTLDGKLYAELGALQQLLGHDVPVEVDTVRDHVFVGNPPVLILAHRHGAAVYVPVKLFARQFGAYTDIKCAVANCGYIWPRGVLDLMTRQGAIGGAGVLGAHADGMIRNIDVRRLPTG
jgi:hypothetical protein